MPANLPAEAKAKWLKVMEARTPEEKLKALQEFLSAVPKHKGTEKLVMQIRRQIATLKREIEIRRKKRVGRGERFFIEKSGDLQVVLIGEPNSGKSAFFTALTRAKSLSSPAPFTTKKPIPGAVCCDGVIVQLIDTPSIIRGASQGALRGNKVLALAKNADALLLVLDGSRPLLEQLKTLMDELEAVGLTIRKPRAIVTIERRSCGGIVILGVLENCSPSDVGKLLREYRIYNALVKIEGRARLEDIEESILNPLSYKPAAIIVAKADLVSRDEVNRLKAAVGSIPIFEFSLSRSFNFEPICRYLIRELGLIRVYTRNPKTGEVEKRPVLVKRGASVSDVAKLIHSRIYKSLKYAKVWSKRFKFNPQRVGRDFRLEDGDIVELVC